MEAVYNDAEVKHCILNIIAFPGFIINYFIGRLTWFYCKGAKWRSLLIQNIVLLFFSPYQIQLSLCFNSEGVSLMHLTRNWHEMLVMLFMKGPQSDMPLWQTARVASCCIIGQIRSYIRIVLLSVRQELCRYEWFILLYNQQYL